MVTHFSVLAWRIPWTENQATVPGVAKESDTTERPSTAQHHPFLHSWYISSPARPWRLSLWKG